jgi:hypothetical protein
MSINGSDETTSEAGRGRSAGGFLGPLRAVALIAAVAGAVCSVGLMLRASHHNPSRLLRALFAIWDIAPFMALVWANMVSPRWSALTRATLYSVTLVITLGSLAIYWDVAFGPPRPAPAFLFLVVPPGSWLLMATVIPTAALISRRLSHQGADS